MGKGMSDAVRKLRQIEICTQHKRPAIPGDLKARWFETALPHFKEYTILMCECWRQVPDERPPFVEVVTRLDVLLIKMQKYAREHVASPNTQRERSQAMQKAQREQAKEKMRHTPTPRR